jgi:hypothetical protein
MFFSLRFCFAHSVFDELLEHEPKFLVAKCLNQQREARVVSRYISP